MEALKETDNSISHASSHDDSTNSQPLQAIHQQNKDVRRLMQECSNLDRLAEAQTNLLIAEPAVGSGPLSRSTLAGQIMAARAQNDA